MELVFHHWTVEPVEEFTTVNPSHLLATHQLLEQTHLVLSIIVTYRFPLEVALCSHTVSLNTIDNFMVLLLGCALPTKIYMHTYRVLYSKYYLSYV